MFFNLIRNRNLLTAEENAPAIWRHGGQLNCIQLFNTLQICLTYTMPAIQHLSGRRKDDGATQIRFVDIPCVLRDRTTGRLDVSRATKPPHFVKSNEFTKTDFFNREIFCQLPELVHAVKTHRTIRLRSFARTARCRALGLGFFFVFVHEDCRLSPNRFCIAILRATFWLLILTLCLSWRRVEKVWASAVCRRAATIHQVMPKSGCCKVCVAMEQICDVHADTQWLFDNVKPAVGRNPLARSRPHAELEWSVATPANAPETPDWFVISVRHRKRSVAS